MQLLRLRSVITAFEKSNRENMTWSSIAALAAARVGLAATLAGVIGVAMGLERASWTVAASVLVLLKVWIGPAVFNAASRRSRHLCRLGFAGVLLQPPLRRRLSGGCPYGPSVRYRNGRGARYDAGRRVYHGAGLGYSLWRLRRAGSRSFALGERFRHGLGLPDWSRGPRIYRTSVACRSHPAADLAHIGCSRSGSSFPEDLRPYVCVGKANAARFATSSHRPFSSIRAGGRRVSHRSPIC